ncbi:IMPACT family protein [Eudoraea chungangensis]|uniref:IMPACT family protein n=1 Tax=Eudoraea chungangensis TaxID=1481905 RepID=UPI0023EDE4F5|nr:YigZ family protein [Eudoraea chungangensis]
MDENKLYKVIKKPTGPIQYKDRKSKFLGYGFGVVSEDEIRGILESLKKKHPTANHFCYAWQLGQHPISYRANDDGEPSNSAGPPIYRQMEAANLTNSLVVVIRFFGGTKLGVGGLINAYRTTAKWTIQECLLGDLIIETTYRLNFKYPLMNAVMRLIKKNNLSIYRQDLKEDCTLFFKVNKNKSTETESAFKNLFGVEINKI